MPYCMTAPPGKSNQNLPQGGGPGAPSDGPKRAAARGEPRAAVKPQGLTP